MSDNPSTMEASPKVTKTRRRGKRGSGKKTTEKFENHVVMLLESCPLIMSDILSTTEDSAKTVRRRRRSKRDSERKTSTENLERPVAMFLETAIESLSIESLEIEVDQKQSSKQGEDSMNFVENDAKIVNDSDSKWLDCTPSLSHNPEQRIHVNRAILERGKEIIAFKDTDLFLDLLHQEVDELVEQDDSKPAGRARKRNRKKSKRTPTNDESNRDLAEIETDVWSPPSKDSHTSSQSEEATKSGSSDGNARKSEKSQKNDHKHRFPDYLPVEGVKRLLADQRNHSVELVEGNIRINPKFYKNAYLTMPDGEADLLIVGLRDRNRALEGDLVVAIVNPEEKWHSLDSGAKQKTGVVVSILERVHSRVVIGFLKPTTDRNESFAMFHPRDARLPLLRISFEMWPENFKAHPDLYADVLFLAEIVHWSNIYFALGKIQKIVGKVGDLEVETNAILLQNGLNVDPYDEELTRDLPPIDYVPTRSDMNDRDDWRNACVFTIDPDTARDLDDALSCKYLDNGNYEVGVHIADVTHFLEALSPLDVEVSKRATTVYLCDDVHHMLPEQLCQICSLLPGQDKLTFSVIWEMTPDAEVVKHRFAKSAINSCMQMSYEQAQAIIENPTKDWSRDTASWNLCGLHSIADVAETVRNLYKLSTKLRDKRFDDGALRIDQPKLQVVIDKASGSPVSYFLQELRESNRLVEEFMLLANMTVATRLYESIPESAFLRRHPQPSTNLLEGIQSMLQMYGVHLNVDSAGSLQSSLDQYEPNCQTESEESRSVASYRMMVINSLCSRAMASAKYFCASRNMSENYLMHYALNVPRYTHFTSPIRRYADCVVHRQLFAMLTNAPLPPGLTPVLCAKIAANCNKKKFSAKAAQEQSTELYFTHLLSLIGPVDTVAIVMDVKDRSIDVILCHVGLKLRIYFAETENETTTVYSKEHSVPTVSLFWKKTGVTQVINIFTILHVRVEKHPTLRRLYGVLLSPNPSKQS